MTPRLPIAAAALLACSACTGGGGGGNHAPDIDGGTIVLLEDIDNVWPTEATDADGDPITLSIVTPPNNGTAVIDGLDIHYTTHPDFFGEDLLVVSASDGTDESEAGFVLSIDPVNDA